MEYFVFANSFAAPFVSDNSTHFVEAETPLEGLRKFVAEYRHPAGLYFAALYLSSDEYHKSRDAHVTWTCNHELKLAELRKKGASMFRVDGPGLLEVDGKKVTVANPKRGEFEGA
jgi:hypothetical protein